MFSTLQRHHRGMEWLIYVAATIEAITIVLYMLLYFQTGSRQLLFAVGGIVLALVAVVPAIRPKHVEHSDSAAYRFIFNIIIFYSTTELVLAGASRYIFLCGIFLIVLAGSVLLSHKLPFRIATAGSFAICIWLIRFFEPLHRYSLTQPLFLYACILIVTAFLASALFWQFIRTHSHVATIRIRLLIAFVLTVLLSSLAIGASSIIMGFEDGRRQTMKQLNSVAILKESEIRTWIRTLEADMNMMLTHEEVMRDVRTLLQEAPETTDYQNAHTSLLKYFGSMIGETQRFEALFLTDLNGKVLFPFDPSKEDNFRTLQPYFRERLNAAGTQVQTLFFSSASEDINTVVGVRPITDSQGQPVGALIGCAGMEKLSEIMSEQAGLGKSGKTYLVGLDKALLTPSRFEGYRSGETYIRTKGVSAALEKRQNGFALYRDYRGIPVIGAYRWLPDLQVALLAEQNEESAFRPIYTTLGINVLVVLTAIFLAVLASLFVTRDITAPLADLAETVKRISNGESDLVARVEQEDEIGALARAFNGMTAQVRYLIGNLEKRVEELKQAEEKLKDYNTQLENQIAERERIEEALRKSEEKYRSIFENSFDGIFQSTPEGRYLSVNTALARICGYDSSEEFMAQVTDIDKQLYVDPNHRREIIRRLEQFGTLSDVESQLYRKDGSTIWISQNVRVVRDGDGKILYYEGTVKDITEQKRAAEALRKSEERYRRFFEDDLTGDFVTSCDGRILECNPAYAHIFGFESVEQAIGTNVIPLYPNAAAREDFLKRLAQEKKLEYYEVEMRRLDGKPLYVIQNAIGIFNKAGELEGCRGYIFDNTDRKKLEEQLRYSQKMEAVGTLAGGIAHDFNNLLQAISGYAQLLLMKKGPDDPDCKKLREIEKSVQRAAELTQQLLTFSRKLESQFKSVDLNQEVVQACKLLRRTIPKMIQVEMRFGSDIKKINADPLQLEQLIMNLALNARDAMPEGGKLVFETENVTLDENYCSAYPEVEPGEYVALSISDSGEGMNKETMDRIFEPFYTTKEIGKGTGLGLAIVYGILKNHHAHVSCYSEPGKGTKFKFYFPVNYPKPSEKTPKSPEAELRGGFERILLVDDEEILLHFGQEMLKQFGYATITAESGEKAIEIYASEKDKIDLVILDLSMPGMGGQKCLQKLLEIDPQVKVIIASGYSMNDTIRETLETGALDYIAKPYQMEEVLKKVREALGKS